MRQILIPRLPPLPSLGLGTWRMGELRAERRTEIAAVRQAIELGYRVIDTAEMYGDGGAEEVVGEAVADAVRAGDVKREELFIVSKVSPHNASRLGVASAGDRSLRRLRIDTLDLYLLHWRGSQPLAETVAGFEELVNVRKVARWGVSNFDADDLAELRRVESGEGCACDQVYYSLSRRGIEFDLLPQLLGAGMLAMAYSPIDQGALAGHGVLKALGERLGATPAQVALGWVVARPGVMAIPKAVQLQHLKDNLAAADLRLSGEDLAELDKAFPPPRRKSALAML